MNKIIQEDVDAFVKDFALADQLCNTVFFITGATGLIGSSLIRCLIALNKGIKVIAPVRNVKKARNMFDADQLQMIQLTECDIEKGNYGPIEKVDYVIHCVAPTSSKFYVEHPVETFNIILNGTKSILEFAQQNNVKSIVYLSSLEVYGEILDDSKPVTERDQGYLDIMSTRSSYPMGKRATETLCSLYASQYGLPVKIARLTQSTGAGIAHDDNRFIAQFAKKALYGQDIILFSSGESAKPCCYITDCVAAILYILLKGSTGECYNVANESTYISVKDLAHFVKKNFNPKISIQINIDNTKGYAATTKLKLSTQKLRNLGWAPKYDLASTIDRLIKYLSC